MNNLFFIVFENENITHKFQEALSQLQHDYPLKVTPDLIATKHELGPTNVYPVLIIELTGSINFSFWEMLVNIAFSPPYIDKIIAIQSGEKIIANNVYNIDKQELMAAIEEMKHEIEHIDTVFSNCKDDQNTNYQSPLSYGVQYSSIF